MEKTITLSDIYAKFTKNFDTFAKMEPFLTFKVGSLLQKTQVSEDGLEPVWKATITLKATTQTEIEITAYEEDLTQNEYMGTAKLNISSLKSSGNHSITIIGQDQKSIGDVFFKYQIEQIHTISNTEPVKVNNIQLSQQIKSPAVQTNTENPTPISYPNSIQITSITAKFTKNFDTFGKMQTFLVFKIGQSKDKTQVYQGMYLLIEDKNEQVKWTKSINLGFDKETQLKVRGYDEDLTENEYMGISTINLKSLSKTGKHTFQMIGQDNKSIGTIHFNYQIAGPFLNELNSQKKTIVESPRKPNEQPEPTKVEKPSPKPSFVESKPQLAEPKPLQSIKNSQRPKAQPVFQKQITPKPKVYEQRMSERVGKKLTQLSEKQLDKNSYNLNNHISRTDQMNKTLHKSRESFKLPDISKNYGDQIYDKQSSSTLQKSILVYSMPKASRFHSGPKYAGQPSYYVDSSFKPNATKGVGFGFGSKRQFPEWMQRNMKQNPAPGAYFEQPKITEVRTKGPTFGISYKHYEKVMIPRQKSPQRVVKSNTRLKALWNAK